MSRLRYLRSPSTLVGAVVAAAASMAATAPLNRSSVAAWLISGLAFGVISALIWVQLDVIRRDAISRGRRSREAIAGLQLNLAKNSEALKKLQGSTGTMARNAPSGLAPRPQPGNAEISQVGSIPVGLNSDEIQLAQLTALRVAIERQTDAALADLVDRMEREMRGATDRGKVA